MPSELMKQASTHLEFLGHKISPLEGEKEVKLVTRPGRCAFTLSANEHIVRFSACFEMKKFEKPGCLQFINSLNLAAVVVSFCKNDFNTLVGHAAFYGAYTKTDFGLFCEAWDHDMFTTLGGRNEELCKYIE